MGIQTQMAAPAKAAHVNMMTDCIIANLPSEGLRSIMRQLLGGDPAITSNFHSLTAKYLVNISPSNIPKLFTQSSESTQSTPALEGVQSRYRCLMGCGQGFESMKILSEIIQQVCSLKWSQISKDDPFFLGILAVLDGDMVQAVTAVQKSLLTSAGMRPLSTDELKVVGGLKESLAVCKQSSNLQQKDFPFERGLLTLEKITGGTEEDSEPEKCELPASRPFVSSSSSLESVKLGPSEVPRMFMGLWCVMSAFVPKCRGNGI